MSTPTNIWTVRSPADKELAVVMGVEDADAKAAADKLSPSWSADDQESGYSLHRLTEDEAMERDFLRPRT